MKAFPRDITVKTMKERHIGIENELGMLTSSSRRDGLPSDFVEAISKRGLLDPYIGFDGGGREFRTVPISVKSVLKQKRGRTYLTEYYEFLKPATEVLRTGGTHIHISILDKDHKNLEANALALATGFFPQFQKVAGRQTSWAQKPYLFDIKAIQAELDRRRSSNTRLYYRSGWILTPTMHQTLEFRGPKGSNDAAEILAWVEFINNVVKVSNRKSVNGIQFKDLLTGERISEYVKSIGLTKYDLNKKLNVNALA
jgi:hypothetical protein